MPLCKHDTFQAFVLYLSKIKAPNIDSVNVFLPYSMEENFFPVLKSLQLANGEFYILIKT